MKKSYFRNILAILSLLASACTPVVQTSSLLAIKVQLGSSHQAAYGGFYAADQNGEYAHEGLAVSFILSGTNTDPVTPVLDNTVQFGITGASALVSARAAGKPIRALATISRRDPVVFFSLANSGITRLQDFIGKKVFVSLRVLPRLNAMLAKAEISPDKINVISTGDFTALYTGDVDVASGTITSNILAARNAGYPVNIIYPDDYGVHFYSNTIFASDNFIAANPDVVTRFLRATLNGWAFAVEKPQDIGAMVTHYNPKADAVFESASMVASIPYVNTGEDHIGWMKADVWAGMLQTMLADGEISKPLDVTNIYTMQFLQQIYGGNKS